MKKTGKLKSSYLLFLLIFFLTDSPEISAQNETASELLTILAKSDSIRQQLTYAGVVEIQREADEKAKITFSIWRDKEQFYLQPPNQGSEPPRSEPRRRDRHPPRDHNELSVMPDQKYLKLFLDNYRVQSDAGSPIARRNTIKLSIIPNHLPRFGLNVWFDTETYLILKREIVYYQQAKETVIFRLQFLDIRFNELPPESIVQSDRARPPESPRRPHEPKRVTFSDLASMKKAINKPISVPSYIPEGCELASINFSQEKERAVSHLHYTDGILNLSVFQFFGKPPRSVKKLLANNNSPENGLSFREVYALQQGSHYFLLIGNFSQEQLKRIGQSLREM